MSQAPEAEQVEQAEQPAQTKEGIARSVVSGLAGRGEGAVRRLVDEVDKNQRVQDARGRLEKIERSVLNRLNVASLDEVVELREQVASLEKRLAKAEAAARRSV